MRSAAVGALVVVSLLLVSLVAAQLPGGSVAQKASGAATGGDGLIVLSTNGQQIVVVDSETRTMGVYHIDPAKGDITLRTIRSLYYDLQLKEYGGTSPPPTQMRGMIEQR